MISIYGGSVDGGGEDWWWFGGRLYEDFPHARPLQGSADYCIIFAFICVMMRFRCIRMRLRFIDMRFYLCLCVFR